MEGRYPNIMTNVNIIDLDEALLVRTEWTPSLWDCGLSGASSAAFFGIGSFFVVGKFAAVAVGSLAGVMGFLFARRPRNFELRITRSEFLAVGKVGDQIGNTRSVSATEVKWLEFQSDHSGPDTAEHPGGMYAILGHRAVCLLPDVDEAQTTMVIARIGEKYPEICAQWAGRTPYGENFISLGLTDGLN